MVKIRTYTGKDAEVIPDLWNKALPCDMISRELFIRKILLDPNFCEKGFFVAENDGTVVGFLNAVFRRVPVGAGGTLESDMGWISAFAVEPSESVAYVGNLLLEAAEKYFAENGKNVISTGYTPVYFTQGVEKNYLPEYVVLYNDRGYTGIESVAMDVDLTAYRYPEKAEKKKKTLIADGFYVGGLKDEYISEYIDSNSDFSNINWSFEFRNRLYMNMDFESVRIAAKDGKVIGACVFGDPLSSPERFGPFGVSDKYRGMGIGTVLLADCLFEMKKRNLHCAWMQWPADTGSAGSLYYNAGFRVTKSYLTFSKRV